MHLKTIQTTLKKTTLSLLLSICLFLFSTLTSLAQDGNNVKKNKEYLVAAYVWPSCHHDQLCLRLVLVR